MDSDHCSGLSERSRRAIRRNLTWIFNFSAPRNANDPNAMIARPVSVPRPTVVDELKVEVYDMDKLAASDTIFSNVSMVSLLKGFTFEILCSRIAIWHSGVRDFLVLRHNLKVHT